MRTKLRHVLYVLLLISPTAIIIFHLTRGRNGNDANLAIDTKSCDLPSIELWNSEIRPSNASERLFCPNFGPVAFDVEITDGLLKYAEVLPYKVYVFKGRVKIVSFKNSSKKDFQCNLLPIHRLHDKSIMYLLPKLDIQNDYELKEYEAQSIVHCYPRDANFNYKEYAQMNDAALAVSQKFLLCSSKTYERMSIKSKHNQYNILLLGLDSISRFDLKRYLPETYSYLSKIKEAFLFTKFTVVGDGTTPNLLALLTGMFEEELPEGRRKASHTKEKFINETVLDKFPWIWDEFKNKAGYITHYIEDSPEWGTFQHRLVGFGAKKSPTDEYGRNCLLSSAQDELVFKRKTSGCTFNRPTHKVLLESMKEVFYRNPNNPIFSLTFLSEMFHEVPRKVSLIDDDLKDVVQLIHESYMNPNISSEFANTILILFSDHGPRIGKRRLSIQGKMEERLPIMYMLFPKYFLDQHSSLIQTLSSNTNKLITLFDVHKTLMEILAIQLTGEIESIPSKHGVSLFKEISKDRSCAEASIAGHWCPCLKWYEMDSSQISESLLKGVTKIIKDYIEDQILRDVAMMYCKTTPHLKIFSFKTAQVSNELYRFLKSADEDGRKPLYQHYATNNQEKPLSYIQIRLGMRRDFYVFESTLQFPLHLNRPENIGKYISRLDNYENHVNLCLRRDYAPNIRRFCLCYDDK